MANQDVNNKIIETPEIEENFLDYDSDLFGTDASELFKNIEDNKGNVSAKMNPDVVEELNWWDPERNTGDVLQKFETVDPRDFGSIFPKKRLPGQLGKSITEQEIKTDDVKRTKMVTLDNGEILEVPEDMKITPEWIKLQSLKEKDKTFIETYQAGMPFRSQVRSVFDSWERGFGFDGPSQLLSQGSNLGFQVWSGYRLGKEIDKGGKYLGKQLGKATRFLGGRKLDPYMARLGSWLGRVPGYNKFAKLLAASTTLAGYGMSNLAVETIGQWSGVYKRNAEAKYVSLFAPFVMRGLGATIYRPTKELIRKIPIWGNAFDHYKSQAAIRWFNDVNRKFRERYVKEHNIWQRIGYGEQFDEAFVNEQIRKGLWPSDVRLIPKDMESALWDTWERKFGSLHIPTSIFHGRTDAEGKVTTGLLDLVQDGIEVFYGIANKQIVQNEIRQEADAALQQYMAAYGFLENPTISLFDAKIFIQDIGRMIGQLSPELDKAIRDSGKTQTLNRLRDMYRTFFGDLEHAIFHPDFNKFIGEGKLKLKVQLRKLKDIRQGKSAEEIEVNAFNEYDRITHGARGFFLQVVDQWEVMRGLTRNSHAIRTLHTKLKEFYEPTVGIGYEPLKKGDVATPRDKFDMQGWLNFLRDVRHKDKYFNTREGLGDKNLKDMERFANWVNTNVGTRLKGPGSLARRGASATGFRRIMSGVLSAIGASTLGSSGPMQAISGIVGATLPEAMVKLTNNKLGQKLIKSLMGVRDYRAPEKEWFTLIPVTSDSIKKTANSIATLYRSLDKDQPPSPMVSEFLKDAAILAHWIGFVDKRQKALDSQMGPQQRRALNVRRFQQR